MREAPKSRILDKRVEFEVRTMPDGKKRAQRIGLHFAPPYPPPGAYPPGPPGDGRRCYGRIRKLDRAKGYGFIEVPGEQDVFFLPSGLPKDMAESRDNLSGIDVSFDLGISQEGKPRATGILPGPPPGPPGPYAMPPMAPYGPPPMGPPMGPPMMGPMGMPPFMGPPMGPMGMMMGGAPDRVYFGHIVSYDPTKGFGFVAAEGVPEDVFFPKGELPPELRDQEKGKVQDKTVSFEIRTMPDGKLRVKNMKMGHSAARGGGGGGGRPRRASGRILKYDKSKGFGFIQNAEFENIFFLRSGLPKDVLEGDLDELKDLEVSFEFYMSDEGKPRARDIVRREDGPPDDGPIPEGEVHLGVILRYDPQKAYGFLKPDNIGEDVFFLRSALPEELREPNHKADIEKRRVEFTIKTMPDGKLRAQDLQVSMEPPPEAPPPMEPPELDEATLTEMAEFIAQRGNSVDYGKFASSFTKVKRKQLEGHFDIVFENKDRPTISLPPDHPLRRDEMLPPEALDGGLDDEPAEDMQVDGEPEAEEPPGSPAEEPEAPDPEGADADVDPDEPSIPPGPGCQPNAVIRTYDPGKGYGFLKVDGMEKDVYFPRGALPEQFHARKRGQMPELNGVKVAFDLDPKADKGPRASRISLLLRWHAGDGCWLLDRAA